MSNGADGPLAGIRVLELASVGPLSYAGNLLAGLGAQVLRIERPAAAGVADTGGDPMTEGRAEVTIDLQSAAGAEELLRLCERADILMEGMRPGVLERLGIGPDVCTARNPRLIVGRISGFGDRGPLASRAGHDINYLALAGALWPMGEPDRPPRPPLNLVGDYGGGAMLLVCGLLAALVERSVSGRGQVVDTSILEGATQLMSLFYRIRARREPPPLEGRRGSFAEAHLNGSAPWYRSFATADGGYVAVGAVEPRFYENLVTTLGLDPASLPGREDPRGWPELHRRFEREFERRSREEWEAVFSEVDACVTGVLAPPEAMAHPQNVALEAFAGEPGKQIPGAAPRFSRTPGRAPPRSPPASPLEAWEQDQRSGL